MRELEINGKKYLAIVNNRVVKMLKEFKDIDVLKDEEMGWLDDPELIEFVGYHALLQGTRLTKEKLDITQEEFSIHLDRVTALEIQNDFIEALNKAWTFALKKATEIAEKSGEEDIKKK